MNQIDNYWRKCSSCKKDMGFKTKYYECSVSTCTGIRTGYVFCSVNCWEVHLPGAKHRDAGAIEKLSPVTAYQQAEATAAPKRIIVSGAPAVSSPTKKSTMSNEVMVVVSKMKQYIRDVSEFNTSEDVNQTISEMIRVECDRAILKAKADGRKTVMARDFQ